MVNRLLYTKEEIEASDHSKAYSLEYYILESELPETEDYGAHTVYGAEIVKKGEVSESHQMTNISGSRESVERLAGMLARNKVTPVSLGYVVEDYISL